MASVEENLRYWDEVYDWNAEGEEWSRGWGGTEALWDASLQPRIARFLPTTTILEIAPGFGRFTGYLREQCENYVGVDLSARCVEACRERFSQDSRCRFFVNDGATLPMLEDGSVDFIFSFFSLIHADEPTVGSYLAEFAKKLRPAGGGFVHHSNLGEHRSYFGRVERLPRPLRQLLFEAGLVDLPQWRAPAISAELFAHLARAAGLELLCQETVNFGSRRTIDAFSSFVRADGPHAAAARGKRNLHWHNPGFMHEAMRVRLRREGRPPQPVTLPMEMYGPL